VILSISCITELTVIVFQSDFDFLVHIYLTRADFLLMVAILGQKLLLHRVLFQIFDSLLAGIDSHDYRMITVTSFVWLACET
jgi:hypothetical protein